VHAPSRPTPLAYDRDVTDELVAAFTAVWSGTAPPELGAILHELCTRVRAAHPGLLADRELVAAIAAHAPPHDVVAFCARCRAPELALATAASRGDASAIAELEAVCAEIVEAAHRRFASLGHTADDLHQILRAKLFVGEPAIARYNGQGSLGAWLRVTAAHLFIDLARRKDRAREVVADPHELDPLGATDVALEAIKAEYRAAVANALVQAARDLPPGDRHVLRQHLVGGLTIDQLAAVLGIHRATAARRIARAREALVARARTLVASKLALDDDELADLFGLVASKLDFSIARLLATPPA